MQSGRKRHPALISDSAVSAVDLCAAMVTQQRFTFPMDITIDDIPFWIIDAFSGVTAIFTIGASGTKYPAIRSQVVQRITAWPGEVRQRTLAALTLKALIQRREL